MTPGQRRRSKVEIWAHILEICTRNPHTQTSILQKVGLNTKTAKNALSFLVRIQLIQCIEDQQSENHTYVTTKRGEDSLTQYFHLMNDYFYGQTDNRN